MVLGLDRVASQMEFRMDGAVMELCEVFQTFGRFFFI